MPIAGSCLCLKSRRAGGRPSNGCRLTRNMIRIVSICRNAEEEGNDNRPVRCHGEQNSEIQNRLRNFTARPEQGRMRSGESLSHEG